MAARGRQLRLPYQGHAGGAFGNPSDRRRQAPTRSLASRFLLRIRRAEGALGMGAGYLREVLRRLLAGELNEEEAEAELKRLQLEDLGGRARLDLGRSARRGLPEVVLAAGKSPADAARLTLTLAREQGQGLASRLTDEHWTALEQAATGLEVAHYSDAARALRPGWRPPALGGRVGLATACCSDR